MIKIDIQGDEFTIERLALVSSSGGSQVRAGVSRLLGVFSQLDRGGGVAEPDADFVDWLVGLGEKVTVISHEPLDATEGRVF